MINMKYRKLKYNEYRVYYNNHSHIIKKTEKKWKKFKENKEYIAKKRGWRIKESDYKKEAIAEFEKLAQPYYERDENHKVIKTHGLKGFDNIHYRRELILALEGCSENWEGDELQLNVDYTEKHPKIKIIYNIKQKKLNAFVREWEIKR